MTQEDKELLLLKELCARLPYGVKVLDINFKKYGASDLISIGIDCSMLVDNKTEDIQYYPIINDIKPYLRPISSMTEEEMDKLFDILHIDKDGKDEDWIKINDDLGIKFFFPAGKWIENVADVYDYLYSIHIDFRGLIPKGLAIEVTENNNPYKE